MQTKHRFKRAVLFISDRQALLTESISPSHYELVPPTVEQSPLNQVYSTKLK